MSFLINLILNLLLVGSMIAFVGLGVVAAVRPPDPIERLIRFGALFAGAMIVVGAQVAGLTYSQFIVDSLSSTQPQNLVAKILWAIVPGGLGAGLGYYLTERARQSTNIAIRIMILIGMLAAGQFAQIYTAAVSEHGLDIGPVAIPNLSFVVGLLLWFVLNQNNNKPTKTGRDGWLRPPPSA
jgi:hypothetical protein